jgi:hypothetical protein
MAQGEAFDFEPEQLLLAVAGGVIGGAALASCSDSQSAESAAAGAQQRLVMIDGGVQPVDYPTLGDALAANTGSVPVTLIVDTPIVINGSVEIPANMSLRFRDAGRLIVSTGSSVRLSGPIEAPASPNHPLFKIEGTGKAIANNPGTTYYANWWSDNSGNAGAYGEPNEADIGQQWNNMVRGLRNDPGAPVPLARHFAVAGYRRLSTMLDFRGFSGKTLDFSGSLLRVDMPQGVAVNLTDSTHLRITRLALQSVNVNASTGAHVGVLLARSTTGPADGSNTFEDLRVIGLWRVAGLYNAASSNNVFIAGVIENISGSLSVGRYAAFFGRHVPSEDSALTTGIGSPSPPTAPHAGIFDGQLMLGTRLRGNVSEATLYIRGFHNFVARSPYTYSVHGLQSHVAIDARDEGVGGIQIDHIYGEGTPLKGLRVFNAIPHRIGTIAFTTRGFETTGSSVSIEALWVDSSKFRVRSGRLFECSPTTLLRDTDIELVDYNAPIRLGALFTGRLMMGDVALLDTITNQTALNAEISSFGEGTSPRTRYALPLSIRQRPEQALPQPPPAQLPKLDAGEAIVSMDPTGRIFARIGPTESCTTVVLVNWDDPHVPGANLCGQ